MRSAVLLLRAAVADRCESCPRPRHRAGRRAVRAWRRLAEAASPPSRDQQISPGQQQQQGRERARRGKHETLARFPSIGWMEPMRSWPAHAVTGWSRRRYPHRRSPYLLPPPLYMIAPDASRHAIRTSRNPSVTAIRITRCLPTYLTGQSVAALLAQPRRALSPALLPSLFRSCCCLGSFLPFPRWAWPCLAWPTAAAFEKRVKNRRRTHRQTNTTCREPA